MDNNVPKVATIDYAMGTHEYRANYMVTIYSDNHADLACKRFYVDDHGDDVIDQAWTWARSFRTGIRIIEG